ncbi:hypothetical protein [Streptomyces sp. NPDC003077]|uniref:hypothetical protein n=1 Tax=Streptomyces sp. NPDC003077 TaxID=3154443 RepID=UPI0033BE80EC
MRCALCDAPLFRDRLLGEFEVAVRGRRARVPLWACAPSCPAVAALRQAAAVQRDGRRQTPPTCHQHHDPTGRPIAVAMIATGRRAYLSLWRCPRCDAEPRPGRRRTVPPPPGSPSRPREG